MHRSGREIVLSSLSLSFACYNGDYNNDIKRNSHYHKHVDTGFFFLARLNARMNRVVRMGPGGSISFLVLFLHRMCVENPAKRWCPHTTLDFEQIQELRLDNQSLAKDIIIIIIIFIKSIVSAPPLLPPSPPTAHNRRPISVTLRIPSGIPDAPLVNPLPLDLPYGLSSSSFSVDDEEKRSCDIRYYFVFLQLVLLPLLLSTLPMARRFSLKNLSGAYFFFFFLVIVSSIILPSFWNKKFALLQKSLS